jgi:hypothetical protein
MLGLVFKYESYIGKADVIFENPMVAFMFWYV